MIDYFRVVAAFFVVAIHTAPFSSIEPRLDAVLTYGLCRIAVPFFLMTTGYFVLGPYWRSGFSDSEKYRRFLKKIVLLYGGAILLYAPFVWYAKKYPKTILDILKMLLFDGAFYHLWYFPALLLGSILVVGLLRHLSERQTFVITGILYLIGLFGDSYYGVVEKLPIVNTIYQGIFYISSYTRNGIFYAPVFLLMGACLWQRKIKQPTGEGCIVALLVMLLESDITYRLELQRHSSMYLALPVVMYFLYPLLLKGTKKARKELRSGTSFLYIIHPIAIILVRGAAKALGLTSLWVDHSLIHYGMVCLVSIVLIVYELYLIKLIILYKRRRAYVSKRPGMD